MAEPLPPDPGCVGCGMCCVRGPCMIATFARPIPHTWTGCSELLWDGERHWCGLYRWRKLLRRLGAIEGPEYCVHPHNAWKGEEPLMNRTVAGSHDVCIEQFPLRFFTSYFDWVGANASPGMKRFWQGYRAYVVRIIERKLERQGKNATALDSVVGRLLRRLWGSRPDPNL